MSLLEEYMEPCVLLEKHRVPDGEGGMSTTWTDGPEFLAAIVLDSSAEALIAQAQGMHNVYTVTVKRSAALAYHDAFRRVRDGQVFRVTSDTDDKRTPQSATLDMAQARAEEWELPNGLASGASRSVAASS